MAASGRGRDRPIMSATRTKVPRPFAVLICVAILASALALYVRAQAASAPGPKTGESLPNTPPSELSRPSADQPAEPHPTESSFKPHDGRVGEHSDVGSRSRVDVDAAVGVEQVDTPEHPPSQAAFFHPREGSDLIPPRPGGVETPVGDTPDALLVDGGDGLGASSPDSKLQSAESGKPPHHQPHLQPHLQPHHQPESEPESEPELSPTPEVENEAHETAAHENNRRSGRNHDDDGSDPDFDAPSSAPEPVFNKPTWLPGEGSATGSHQLRRSAWRSGRGRRLEPSRTVDASRSAFSPLVSLVMPTHGTSRRLLLAAMECARLQTYPNLELIVLDAAPVPSLDESTIRVVATESHPFEWLLGRNSARADVDLGLDLDLDLDLDNDIGMHDSVVSSLRDSHKRRSSLLMMGDDPSQQAGNHEDAGVEAEIGADGAFVRGPSAAGVFEGVQPSPGSSSTRRRPSSRSTDSGWFLYRHVPGMSVGDMRQAALHLARGSVVVHWDAGSWHSADRVATQVDPILRGLADVTVLDVDSPCVSSIHSRVGRVAVAPSAADAPLRMEPAARTMAFRTLLGREDGEFMGIPASQRQSSHDAYSQGSSYFDETAPAPVGVPCFYPGDVLDADVFFLTCAYHHAAIATVSSSSRAFAVPLVPYRSGIPGWEAPSGTPRDSPGGAEAPPLPPHLSQFRESLSAAGLTSEFLSTWYAGVTVTDDAAWPFSHLSTDAHLELGASLRISPEHVPRGQRLDQEVPPVRSSRPTASAVPQVSAWPGPVSSTAAAKLSKLGKLGRRVTPRRLFDLVELVTGCGSDQFYNETSRACSNCTRCGPGETEQTPCSFDGDRSCKVVGRQYFLQLSQSIIEEIKRARKEYERSILAIANIYKNSDAMAPFTVPHYDITVVAMDLKVAIGSVAPGETAKADFLDQLPGLVADFGTLLNQSSPLFLVDWDLVSESCVSKLSPLEVDDLNDLATINAAIKNSALEQLEELSQDTPGAVNTTLASDHADYLLLEMEPAVDQLRLTTLRLFDLLVTYEDLKDVDIEDVRRLRVVFQEDSFVLDEASLDDPLLHQTLSQG